MTQILVWIPSSSSAHLRIVVWDVQLKNHVLKKFWDILFFLAKSISFMVTGIWKIWVRVRCDFSSQCGHCVFTGSLRIQSVSFNFAKTVEVIFITMPIQLKTSNLVNESIKHYVLLMCWKVWGILLWCFAFLVLGCGQILSTKLKNFHQNQGGNHLIALWLYLIVEF